MIAMSTKTIDCRNLPVSMPSPLPAWQTQRASLPAWQTQRASLPAWQTQRASLPHWQTRRASLPAWQTGTIMVHLVTERFEGTEHPARDLPAAA
jgi:hypothetical protein